jgi:hypothetical protein
VKEDSDHATQKVLLIPETLVGGNQGRESSFLSLREQLSIAQIAPAFLECGSDLVAGQLFAQRLRPPLVEENAH